MKWGAIALLVAVSLLTLFYGSNPFEVSSILNYRLPRLIVLLATGASLAVSGAIMQALFQNPLASPSVLGISFGGSLLVVIASIFDLPLHFPYALSIAAFSGCLLTLLLVYGLSRSPEGVFPHMLILTGIAVSTVFLALQGALLYALKDRWQLILTLTEWEAGSTYHLTWKQVHIQLPLTFVGLFGAFYYRRTLNLLALGDEEALALGVNVKTVRFRLFLAVSLLTGGALAAVGIIAFFGLILPHVIRTLTGSDNERLIPYAIVGGAIILSLLDISLRVLDIHNFTIGNISAILGGAFFLLLLYQNKRRSFYAYT